MYHQRITSKPRSRVVHGLGLCPTRTQPQWIQVGKSLTRNRPGLSSGSIGSGHISFGSISVGFGFVGVEQNLARFWLKYCWISSDLVGSNKIQLIFPYIYKYRAEILMDLAEIYLSDRLKGLDLPFLVEFVISDEGRKTHWVGQVCQFLKQPTRNSNRWSRVLRRRLTFDRDQALIGRFQVKMIGFRAVQSGQAGSGQPYLEGLSTLPTKGFEDSRFKRRTSLCTSNKRLFSFWSILINHSLGPLHLVCVWMNLFWLIYFV